MTKKETLRILEIEAKKIKEGMDIWDEEEDRANARKYLEVLDTVIKALEQEPCDYYNSEIKTCRRLEVPKEDILDKIRAEIEVKLAEPQYQHEGEDWQNGLIMAEIIIDKYKAESEDI